MGCASSKSWSVNTTARTKHTWFTDYGYKRSSVPMSCSGKHASRFIITTTVRRTGYAESATRVSAILGFATSGYPLGGRWLLMHVRIRLFHRSFILREAQQSNLGRKLSSSVEPRCEGGSAQTFLWCALQVTNVRRAVQPLELAAGVANEVETCYLLPRGMACRHVGTVSFYIASREELKRRLNCVAARAP